MPRPFFGYHMPSYTFADVPRESLFDRVAGNARAAENAGFDLITVMDHFYQIRGVGPEEEPMMEAYTMLGALAALTSKALLGTMVSGVTYRNPAMLAKIVTSLDVISKGRAVFGIGAAWNDSEHAGYGFEFPPIGQRMDRLEEALAIAKRMFTEERPTYEGRYYRIERALNVPRPVRPGGPPILIGGSGERRTLRLVAEYADISNWWGTLDELRHKSEVLDRHCEAVGRDPSTIIRTVMAPVVLVESERDAARTLEQVAPERRAQMGVGTPDRAAERLRPYLDAGFGGFILRNPGMSTPESLGLAGELISLMRPRETVAAGS